MIRIIRGKQGLTAIMAIGFMSVLGIFIAGLLPFLSNVDKLSASTQYQIQAAFAAEAGGKRAIVSLARYAYDNSSTATAWSWLGASTTVINDASVGTYTVTLQRNGANFAPTAGALIPEGNYTITSIGSFKNFTNTISIGVAVGSDNQVDFKTLQWRK